MGNEGDLSGVHKEDGETSPQLTLYPHEFRGVKPRKVIVIFCDLCAFGFERDKIDEARFFANVHNEEAHNSSLTVVDETVT